VQSAPKDAKTAITLIDACFVLTTGTKKAICVTKNALLVPAPIIKRQPTAKIVPKTVEVAKTVVKKVA
jgi:hypothetical protein